MGETTLTLLIDAIESLKASGKRLENSYEICAAIGAKESYSDEELIYFESLTARFERSIDMLTAKALRALDAYEYGESGTLIDLSNRAEKRGVIDAASDLRALKEMRNEVAHEYQDEDLQALFSRVLALTPKLSNIIDRVVAYCDRYLAGKD